MNILTKLFRKFFYRNKTKMEKEIFEQPDVIFELIKKYIKKDYSINIELNEDVEKVALIASGSSYHSASTGADFMRNYVNINSQAYYASELVINDNFTVDNETLYIFISQSGETTDTNLALEKIKNKTDKILAITNVKNSKLWNNSKYRILTEAGTEKAVASTKSTSAQLFCLLLTALKLAEIKKLAVKKYINELLNVPECIKNILIKTEQIKEYVKNIADYEQAVVLASGMFYPLAKEGALKIKEISYINTTAYPTGEFLHGHIAVLNKKCVVIVLVNNQNINSVIDVLMKIKDNYKPEILIISSLPLKELDRHDFFQIEAKNDIEFLFSSLVVFQLMAFETAVLLNRNIDNPKGLSKIIR